MQRLTVVLAVLSCLGCGRAVTDASLCGDGTKLVNETCVATGGDIQCGPGTTLKGAECVAIGGITCGSGTMLSGSTCVATSLSCGPGTMQVGAQCVPSGGAPSCGAGTMLVGSQCLPSGGAVTCGTGTTLSGSTCVASDRYEVRLPVTHVPADGYSNTPVFSIGTLASGAVSMEQVILTVNPSTAGTVSPSAFALDELGSTSFFTPCNSSAPTCTGTFEIDLALASSPGTVVATSGSLTLDLPNGVFSTANCVGSTTSVIFFDGESGDPIHPGMESLTQGTFSAYGSVDDVTLSLFPPQAGAFWYLEFSTSMLSQPLQQNIYLMAERAPFASPGHPGLEISGDGVGCNTISGSFQIENITWTNGMLTDLLASFEQHCDGLMPALRGCVHYH